MSSRRLKCILSVCSSQAVFTIIMDARSSSLNSQPNIFAMPCIG